MKRSVQVLGAWLTVAALQPAICEDVDRSINTGGINVNQGVVGSDFNRGEIRQWQHNPEHRGGVRYRNNETAQRVDALIEAAVSDDPSTMQAVLGPDAEGPRSGDAVADSLERQRLIAAALEAATIEEHGDDHAVLAIGNDHWPFPIPLTRDNQGWRAVR